MIYCFQNPISGRRDTSNWKLLLTEFWTFDPVQNEARGRILVFDQVYLC